MQAGRGGGKRETNLKSRSRFRPVSEAIPSSYEWRGRSGPRHSGRDAKKRDKTFEAPPPADTSRGDHRTQGDTNHHSQSLYCTQDLFISSPFLSQIASFVYSNPFIATEALDKGFVKTKERYLQLCFLPYPIGPREGRGGLGEQGMEAGDIHHGHKQSAKPYQLQDTGV